MKITIIETSDVHGYLSQDSFRQEGQKEGFSLSKVKSYIDSLRESGEKVIYIDNGDTIQGSPLTSYYRKNRNISKLIKGTNLLKPDIWVLGNHDFNNGQDYLKEAIDAFSGTVLSANLIQKRSEKKLKVQPYKIIEIQGIKIGIIGLTTMYVPKWETKENVEGLEFISAYEAAEKYVPIVKEVGADLVVLSYHGGFERDIQSGQLFERETGENEGYKIIASDLPIDVFLTGHQHRVIAEKYKDLPIVQPGFASSYIGKVEVEFDSNKKPILIEGSLVETKGLIGDIQLEDFIKEDMAQVQKDLDKVAGKIYPQAQIENVIEAQALGHPYINLINQIQMEATDTDISATAIYKSDAKGIKELVTMRDIINNYPYTNTLIKIKVTGKELKEILNHNSKYFILNEKGNLVVNPSYIHPKNQIYNYDIYSGIEYTYDYRQPYGQALVSLKYKGKEVEDSQILYFSTNSYRAKGGGDVPVLDGSQIQMETTKEADQLIYDYIKEKEEVKIKDLDSVRIIGYRDVEKKKL